MDNVPKITDRDKLWLRELAAGKSPKELTGATMQGVRNRLYRLRQRFGVATTTQLVMVAEKMGLLGVVLIMLLGCGPKAKTHMSAMGMQRSLFKMCAETSPHYGSKSRWFVCLGTDGAMYNVEVSPK